MLSTEKADITKYQSNVLCYYSKYQNSIKISDRKEKNDNAKKSAIFM